MLLRPRAAASVRSKKLSPAEGCCGSGRCGCGSNEGGMAASVSGWLLVAEAEAATALGTAQKAASSCWLGPLTGGVGRLEPASGLAAVPPGCAAFSADRTCMRAAACASTATLCPAASLPGVDAGNPPPVSSAGACCCPSKPAVPGLAGASRTLPSASTLCSVPLPASSAAAGCLAAA